MSPVEKTGAFDPGLAWKKIRAKSPRQLGRFTFTRIWPFSVLGKAVYACLFSKRWHRHANRQARQAFTDAQDTINSTESQLLSQLNADGIFIDSKNLVFSSDDIEQLIACADTFWNNARNTSQLDNRKSVDGSKWYVLRAFGKAPPPLPPAIQRIIFNTSLLNVVSHYLQSWPKLRYLDLWHNVAAEDHEPAIDSENWHRDNEDLHIVTLFLYLNDIDKDQGNFEYIRESQRGGKYGHVAPASPPIGSYPPSDVIFPQIPADNIMRCAGKTGTLVLCDTSGLHRGGRVLSGKRLVLTARYFSSAGIDRIAYKLEPNSHFEDSSRVRFLLS